MCTLHKDQNAGEQSFFSVYKTSDSALCFLYWHEVIILYSIQGLAHQLKLKYKIYTNYISAWS